jgi:hypothetical protein
MRRFLTLTKKLIFDFVNYCFSEGLSKHRVIKYISILKSIALQIQIDFDKVEKKDLYRFISDLERTAKCHKIRLSWRLDKGDVESIAVRSNLQHSLKGHTLSCKDQAVISLFRI